ncbi:MAG: hypothetical protein AAFP07_22245, partial [Cyanobacteria bacterium J06606_4]
QAVEYEVDRHQSGIQYSKEAPLICSDKLALIAYCVPHRKSGEPQISSPRDSQSLQCEAVPKG